MLIKIPDKKKWIVLAYILLIFYTVASMIWAIIRIKFAITEEKHFTDIDKIKSSFICLSPNLITFSYLVWKVYCNNKHKSL